MPRGNDDDDPPREDTQPLRPVRRPPTSPRSRTPARGVIVEPDSWEEPQEGTGSRRRITPSDAAELVEIQTRAQQIAARDERAHELELLLAEWFGARGEGGRLKAMEAKIADHETQLGELGHFKTRILTIISIGVALSGAGMAAIIELMKYLLHR